MLTIRLSEVHFDAVKQHLVSTLRDLEVAEELIYQVEEIAESTRGHVLGWQVH